MGQMTGKIPLPALACFLAGALAAVQGGAGATAVAPEASPQTLPAQAQIVFPTSAPASPADSPQARRFKLILASRVKLLAAAGESSQARAKAVLMGLQQACLDSLIDLSDDKDPEVAQAALDLLGKYSLECRVARALAMLEPAQAQKFLELRGRHPALVAQLLGDNMTARIAALRKLVSLKDPGHLAEPLLAMCLWHSYRPLRTAAAEIVADKEYDSDDIIDAVTDIVVEGIRRARYYGNGDTTSAESFAMQALYRLRPRRAAGKIFAAMRESRYYHISAPVELLVQLDEKRLVPVLVAEIQSDPSAAAPESAWMLDALLRLTNQSLSDYGVRRDNLNAMTGEFGAYQIENWDKATSRLAAWWKKNKDTPPYRNLQPLPIPKLPALTASDDEGFPAADEGEDPQVEEGAAIVVQPPREGPQPGNGADSTATTGPSADADLYDTAALDAQIRRLVALCVEGLRSERPKERLRSQEAILSIERSILDAMVQAKRESQAGVLPMLTALAVRCEMAARLGGMSDSDRRKVARYAQHHALIVEEFFSLAWSQQAQALVKMQAQSDPLGDAEPLVALAMKHPWPAMRNRAVAMTVGKSDNLPSPYHGQAVVDALCDLLAARLAASSNVSFPRRFVRFRPNDNNEEYVDEELVLRALRQIKSKRAAPILLSMMAARRDPYFQQSNFYADALLAQTLAATGEIRAVPMLCELLQGPDTRMWSTQMDNKSWSFSDRDNTLYALLLLTRQAPLDYKMMIRDQDGQIMVGFTDPEARKAAVEKFQLWWRENQDQPPYKDIVPLAVPIPDPFNPGYPRRRVLMR